MLCIPTGLAALAKIIIASEHKTIPANLHYNKPNPEIPGLSDSRLQVVSQNTKWQGGLTAINNFGFGGANVHAVLNTKAAQEKVKLQYTASENLSENSSFTKFLATKSYMLIILMYIFKYHFFILQKVKPADSAVRLLTYCGRTEDTLRSMLENVRDTHSEDLELHALLSQSASQSYRSQPYRGYVMLNSNEETAVEIQVWLLN